MPKAIAEQSDIKPGDLYEDSYKHPCVCVEVNNSEVKGISLVDGSYPRNDDLQHVTLRRLTAEEAWQWRLCGPSDRDVEEVGRWWQRDKSAFLINPGKSIENLFFFALYEVQWNEKVQEALGQVEHQWHEVSYQINEHKAMIRFKVRAEKADARVYAEAYSHENAWVIDSLEVEHGEERIALIKDGENCKAA